MDIVYDLNAEFDNALKDKHGITGLMTYFNDLVQSLPDEKQMLYPGKLYIFTYKTKSNALYDTMPYIMSLGASKTKKTDFYGIDMHWIPRKIRVQIFSYIYDKFKWEIQSEIAEFPDKKDAQMQKYIIQLTTDFIDKAPFKVNISQCMHTYNIKNISQCHCINWNLIHYMLLSDEDYFANGSIADAQKKFIESMNIKKPKK